MEMNPRITLAAGVVLLPACSLSPPSALPLNGSCSAAGPAGGTFQIVASAIQTYGPVKKSKDYRVKAQYSAGSVENLRKVNAGKMQFGVIHSGHLHLGRAGRLKNDGKKYDKVLAVACLSSPARL